MALRGGRVALSTLLVLVVERSQAAPPEEPTLLRGRGNGTQQATATSGNPGCETLCAFAVPGVSQVAAEAKCRGDCNQPGSSCEMVHQSYPDMCKCGADCAPPGPSPGPAPTPAPPPTPTPAPTPAPAPTPGDWTLMHGVSFHSCCYTGPELCRDCHQGDCNTCWAQGQVINDFACETGNAVSYGHGVYDGQECGTCAWVKCVDGDTYTCKDTSVFAHMRVDNPRSPANAAEISTDYFLARWPEITKMDLKYEVMPNPNCDVTYPGR